MVSVDAVLGAMCVVGGVLSLVLGPPQSRQLIRRQARLMNRDYSEREVKLAKIRFIVAGVLLIALGLLLIFVLRMA